jgi:succinoglycan biosynthesis protein ExoU
LRPDPGSSISVCVVIAAYNASGTVGRAVASALRQPQVSQVVIVDDSSNDETLRTALSADDGSGRVSTTRQAENRGPAAARNRALALAQAEFVCVLDADDWLQDGRFARMLASTPAEWDFLADDLLLATESTPEVPWGRLLELPDGTQAIIDLPHFIRANLPDPRRPRRELGYLKPLMRREFLQQAGLCYDETLRLGEDYTLYAQALLRGARFILAPACGYVAVERTGSLSRAHGVAEIAALLVADDKLIQEARQSRPDAVNDLRVHRRSVSRNLEYRLLLDAKRRGDWAAVARGLLGSPGAFAYVMRETVRARLVRRGRSSRAR